MPENLFGESNQWFLLIPLVIIIAVSFLMKRRKQEKNPQEIAMSLLVDLNANQKIADDFNFQQRPNKLKTGSWDRNSMKIDFLDDVTRSSLSTFFKMAEDFNLQVDAAKRYKSTIHLSGISVDKLKGPLTKAREGLGEWLGTNTEQAGPGAGRSGCLGGGFGG